MSEHARMGGSGASRWMKCPGSVLLSEGQPDPVSPYAQEGSAAHALAEICLDGPFANDPTDFVGLAIHLGDGSEWEVTMDMAQAVQVYVDAVREAAGDELIHVEEQFTLEKLNPPEPMFGTADAVIWKEDDRLLDVWDYKHGMGVFVGVEENEQFLFYALGAVLKLHVRPDRIRVNVVQPRAGGDPVRSWEFDFARLSQFAKDVIRAANAAQDPDAELVVGDHCRFCRAKAICPAQKSMALEVTQQEFEVMTPDARTLPDPTGLSDDEILAVLDKANMIEDWFNSIRDYVKDRLEKGEEIPGWKLVAKRASRRWVDEEDAEKYLRRHLKVAGTYERKMLSPAKAEKALKQIGKDLPEDKVVSVSSGVNLAPADNPKPAVVIAAAEDEFAAIQAGD